MRNFVLCIKPLVASAIFILFINNYYCFSQSEPDKSDYSYLVENSSNYQDTTTYVYFKDGSKMSRNNFMSNCIKSVQQQNGDIIIADKYCSCVIEKIAKNFTLNEYESLSKSGNHFDDALRFFSTDVGKKIATECTAENINYNSKSDYPTNFKKTMISAFQSEVNKDAQFVSLVDINKFCECLVDKIMTAFKYPEFFKISVQGTLQTSPKFIQARDECLASSYK